MTDFAIDHDEEQNLANMAGLMRNMGYVHRSELRELIEQWRSVGPADGIVQDDPHSAIDSCADELEAVLDE